MTITEYQSKSYTNIQPHADLKDEMLNWAVGLCEETGEVMNHIKHACWGNEDINKEEFAKEIGDVLWYLAALCTSCNLNLETIANLNYKKLEHRFGNGFSEDKSKNRHDSELKFSETDVYKNIIKDLMI